MRVVIQRVSRAKVIVEKKYSSQIQQGLLILLGIEHNDTEEDANWLVQKVINLRIFNDDNGVMNVSLQDINGEAIVVSQFTLHASTKKGNRPSYIKAANPEQAIPLYEYFLQTIENKLGKNVGTGVFGAHMELDFVNDGPVTIIMDSKNRE
jgi:D-tyrosyl-tRNA(Tyr) deacylase